MNKLNNYFTTYSDKIVFLTIKELKANNKVFKNIDLPVYYKTLIDNIKNDKFSDEISTDNFIEGILLLNGINNKFENIDNINSFLFESLVDLNNFINSRIKYDFKDIDTLIYNLLLIRGGDTLIKLDNNLKKFHCKLLIDILDNINVDFYNIFNTEIKNRLNNLYNEIPEDPYIHLMFGDIYKKESLFIKSKISYENAIKYSQNNDFIKFLRKNIDEIFVKAELEQILIWLNSFKYENVYNSLNILQNKKLQADDYYWIGFIHYKLNEFDIAISYYEKSLNLGINYLNLFLELGVSYYNNKQYDDAIRIYNLALKIYKDDENIMFNKILINIKFGNLNEAKNDIERLLLYEDLNIHIMNDILYLKNLYNLD